MFLGSAPGLLLAVTALVVRGAAPGGYYGPVAGTLLGLAAAAAALAVVYAGVIYQEKIAQATLLDTAFAHRWTGTARSPEWGAQE